jgi:glycosyltransferase involved in cell wall biosynthesis
MDDVMPRELVPIRNRIQSFERPIYEYGLRQADAVITQASYQAVLLREYFGRTDAEVIPNYHPAPPKKDKTDAQGQTVLWVANLKAAKRPEIFFRLAEMCADLANAKFIMVGAIQDRRYESMLEQSASLRNFRYMGPLPLEEVNQLMDSADIFVNTSTSFGEGFPNTFIQAWLRRVAVVSLEVNPDHMMDDRQIGICSASSIEQLVLDVRTLLLGPDRLQLMTSTAYEHAVNNYGAINLSRIQSTLERNAIAAPRKRI